CYVEQQAKQGATCAQVALPIYRVTSLPALFAPSHYPRVTLAFVVTAVHNLLLMTAHSHLFAISHP
ncbi:MAG TPA: hypothetical protein PLD30_15190, partial [Candidatus Competibacteraceae bacterium]|nr:hypothetical protein [Candidatus Competibacteraceae bacterium]